MQDKKISIRKFHLLSIVLALLLATLSAIKPINLLPDMAEYNRLYDYAISNEETTIEKSFILISKFIHLAGGSFSSLIFIIAFLSIIIKLHAIRNIKEKYLFLILYAPSFMILHEFIQIRIGLAISLLFAGSFLYFNYKKRHAAACFLIAPLIHYSALIFPIGFYISTLISEKKFTAILCFFIFTLLISFIELPYLELLPVLTPSPLHQKIEIYQKLQESSNESMNLLSIRLIIFYVLSIEYWRQKKLLEPIDRTILTCCLLILCVAFLTKQLPPFSLRVTEIAGPFFIFLIARMKRYSSKSLSYTLATIFTTSSIYYSFLLFQ